MTTTYPTTYGCKVWVRYDTLDGALASARRLAAKYGNRFAIVSDDCGISGFTHPFAIVSPA